jgi:hypothetical protein
MFSDQFGYLSATHMDHDNINEFRNVRILTSTLMRHNKVNVFMKITVI